jgi:hypothetical protein
VRNGCRTFFLASFALAYLAAYFLLSSNSDVINPMGEVVYVDRESTNDKNETQTESLYELHLSEIQNTASKMAHAYEPVRCMKREEYDIRYFTHYMMITNATHAQLYRFSFPCDMMNFSRTLRRGVSIVA